MDAFSTFFTDPVTTRTFASALAVVLIVGGWQKLREPDVFAAAVQNYRLLPDAFVPPLARLLPLLEMLAGGLLLFPASCESGGVLAAGLLVLVTGAVVLNLLRGRREIDCGCGGISGQPLSWALVARNGVLLLLTLPASLQGEGRSLFLEDYFTLGGGVLALVGLYLCTNQLLSNAPMQHAHRN